MTDRYFVDSPIAGPSVTLAGVEAHHLLHVMRGAPGQPVVLFDGTGCEFASRVERLRRTEVDLAIEEKRRVDRELPFSLNLAAALPKGDRQKWLIEKSVELGVTRFIPLDTNRSVAQAAAGALDRLRRSVIEASKQCGRNVLMSIEAPCPWREALVDAPANAVRWMAHPTPHNAVGDSRPPHRAPAFAEAWLAVGPEGGWTDDEVSAATAAGWQIVDLGPRILRVETAAALLVAMVVARSGVSPVQ